MKALDIQVGKKYGMWTVLSTHQHLQGKKDSFCYCVCDCGNTGFVSDHQLVHGKWRNCGCYKPRFHGGHRDNQSHSRLYNVWSGMRSRCNNPENPSYHNYGGRGIAICDEWKNDFFAFRDWALANGCDDEDGLTLDRIDNDGNYCPENCKWSTHEEQSNNRRANVYLTYNGKTQSIARWARELGLRSGLISTRINKLGWSVERALNEPVHNTQPYRKEVTNNG